MPLDSTTETIWNNESLPAAEVSSPISLATASRVRILGSTDAATSFDVLFGTTTNGAYYRSEFTIAVGGADQFSLAFDVEAPYMKIRCNDAAVVTLKLVKKISSIL